MNDLTSEYIEYMWQSFLRDIETKAAYKNTKISFWKEDFFKPLVSWPLTTFLSGLRACVFTTISCMGLVVTSLASPNLVYGDGHTFQDTLSICLTLTKKAFEAWIYFFMNVGIPVVLAYRLFLTALRKVIPRKPIPGPMSEISDVPLTRSESAVPENIKFLIMQEKEEIQDFIKVAKDRNTIFAGKTATLEKLYDVYLKVMTVCCPISLEEPDKDNRTFLLAVPKVGTAKTHTFSPDIFYILAEKKVLEKYETWKKNTGRVDLISDTRKRVFYPVFIREGEDNKYYPDSEFAAALILSIRKEVDILRKLNPPKTMNPPVFGKSIFWARKDAVNNDSIISPFMELSDENNEPFENTKTCLHLS